MTDIEIPWGPTGEVVYQRTYSRKKPDGTQETWPETVDRVATGNLSLVYGPRETWSEEVQNEYDRLTHYMLRFAILPAGRHLWASGVKGRQYLFNCHVAGWGEKLSRHFEFTFLRLMEGGGVGANYSSEFLAPFGAPRRQLKVHIVCDPSHPDYEEMQSNGVLSTEYDSDWPGSFEVEDSREGWASALVDLIDTYMTDDEVRHENRVYDVSRVRCRGSRLKTFGGTASGPAPFARMMVEVGRILNGANRRAAPQVYIAKVTDNAEAWTDLGSVISLTVDPDLTFGLDDGQVTPLEAMEIDHAIAECVVSGGNRRSARMAMLPWDDSYIEEFLTCKQDTGKHWTTNISVVIDNRFTEALAMACPGCDDPTACLKRVNRAERVHKAVVTGMLTNGEPGYWHIDNANIGEPNPVIATNPCGEIALESWENCNLGHVNLDAFAPKAMDAIPDIPDWAGLYEAHRLVTRFLIRATYGDVNDSEQAAVLARNRRIGVGHLGVQGFWAKQGVSYSRIARDYRAEDALCSLYYVVREAATKYAHDLRIPVPVKTTAMAPTGSVAKLPGVPESAQIIFAKFFEQRVRFSLRDDDQRKQVEDYASQGFTVETDRYDPSGYTVCVVFPTKNTLIEQVEALGYSADVVESADEISLDDMLSVQELYQEHWADNAVSFTVNVPAEPHQQEVMLADPDADVPLPSPERVAEVARTLAGYLGSLKGTTLMLDGSRPQAPYTRITEEQYEAALAKMVSDGIDEECASGACPVR